MGSFCVLRFCHLSKEKSICLREKRSGCSSILSSDEFLLLWGIYCYLHLTQGLPLVLHLLNQW
jgi:hypothetical protein